MSARTASPQQGSDRSIRRSTEEPGRAPSRRRRSALSLACWYFLPFLVVCAAGAFMYSTMVLHLNPPVVPVEGNSMRPVLVTGDLVVLEPAKPASLQVGDVIAFHVPGSYRSSYGVPANIVHRIVAIKHDATGRVFITKGDANSGRDVFQTPASDVIGKLHFVVPWLGYPALFIQSTQGRIFLGGVVVVVLLYFGFGLFDERRAASERTLLTMSAVLSETERLERFLVDARAASERPGDAAPGAPPGSRRAESAAPKSGAAPAGPAPAGPVTPRAVTPRAVAPGPFAPGPVAPGPFAPGAVAPVGPLDPAPTDRPSPSLTKSATSVANEQARKDAELLEGLERAVLHQAAKSEEVDRSLRGFAEAVGDYATHLESHTAVMRELAMVAAGLRAVVGELDRRLTSGELPAATVPAPVQSAPSAPAVDEDADAKTTEDQSDLEAAQDPSPADEGTVGALRSLGADSIDPSPEAGETVESPPLAQPTETPAEARGAIVPSSWDLERWAAYETWCASAADEEAGGGDETGIS